MFGIAPTGYAGLWRPGGEEMLAEAAAEAGIPFVQSGSSVASVEAIGKVAPGNSWFQLYAARDPETSADILRRAADSGVETVAVTVDLPVQSPRPRDMRSGWHIPPKLTPRIILSGILHPGWTWGYLTSGGLPRMGNWAPYAGDNADAIEISTFMRKNAYSTQTWADMERYRKIWKGNLVLKGILHADDARRAADIGVDGILVSNHGGRQFERAPAPIEVLPGIVEAVGSRLTVMMDSGISNGVDMLIASMRSQRSSSSAAPRPGASSPAAWREQSGRSRSSRTRLTLRYPCNCLASSCTSRSPRWVSGISVRLVACPLRLPAVSPCRAR
jgi:L-lactate dehydrogenase (cytochrome)/(S)-mandelate dehydrogenase